jgi:hypothetical protein
MSFTNHLTIDAMAEPATCAEAAELRRRQRGGPSRRTRRRCPAISSCRARSEGVDEILEDRARLLDGAGEAVLEALPDLLDAVDDLPDRDEEALEAEVLGAVELLADGAAEKPPCSKSCVSRLEEEPHPPHRCAGRSRRRRPRLRRKATTKPATTAPSTATMRIAGSKVARMPPMVMPSALNPMASSAMAALAAMTPPTSIRKPPTATTSPAKIFLMGAGMAWKARRTALSASTSRAHDGLEHRREGLAEHDREGLQRAACSRVFCPSKVSSSCSRKRPAVPSAPCISVRNASMASAPRRVTSRPSRMVVKLAFITPLNASNPRAPKACTTRRLRSASLMSRVAVANSLMMSTIERICPDVRSKTWTPVPRMACWARLSEPTRRVASRKAVAALEASMFRLRRSPMVISTSLRPWLNTAPVAAALASPASKSRVWKLVSWVMRSSRSVTPRPDRRSCRRR